MVPDDSIRESKALISMYSANSFSECDGMFIPDFVKLDEVVKNTLDKREEEAQDMLNVITTMMSASK